MAALAVLVKKPVLVLPAPSDSCDSSKDEFRVYLLPVNFPGGCENKAPAPPGKEDRPNWVCNERAPFIRFSLEEFEELSLNLRGDVFRESSRLMESRVLDRLRTEAVTFITARRASGDNFGTYLCVGCKESLCRK